MSNIKSSLDMKSNGWFVNVDYSNTHIERGMSSWFPDYSTACGIDTFFGYKRNNELGTVSYTFRGYGKITLNIGNCYKGFVSVFVNNVRLTYIKGREFTKFEFQYKRGDVLLISEYGIAMIKLRNIYLSCMGKYDTDLSLICCKFYKNYYNIFCVK